jgi:hypothetical protein
MRWKWASANNVEIDAQAVVEVAAASKDALPKVGVVPSHLP